MPKNNHAIYEEPVSFNEYLNSIVEEINSNLKKIKSVDDCNKYFTDLSTLHIKLGSTKILIQQVLDRIEENIIILCKKNTNLIDNSDKLVHINNIDDISDSDMFNNSNSNSYSDSDSDEDKNNNKILPQNKVATMQKQLVVTQNNASPNNPVINNASQNNVAQNNVAQNNASQNNASQNNPVINNVAQNNLVINNVLPNNAAPKSKSTKNKMDILEKNDDEIKVTKRRTRNTAASKKTITKSGKKTKLPSIKSSNSDSE